MDLLRDKIDVIGGAMQHFKASQLNLQAIGEARMRMDKERSDLEFSKKENALKLEKLQREGRISSLEADILDSQMKEYNKQQKAKLDVDNNQINNAEHEQLNISKDSADFMEFIYQTDPQGIDSVIQGAQDSLSSQSDGSTELQPVISGGRVGFKSVNRMKEAQENQIRQNKLNPSSKSVSRKEIFSAAVELFKANDKEGKISDYMGEAEAALTGKSAAPSVSKPRFVPGEIRVHAGDKKKYQRGVDGLWHQIP